jgi:predicted RNase H-like nuclease (RuvC/YqgF family)
MQTKVWLKTLLMVPALCVAGLPAMAQQQSSGQQQSGDPVADAARKAREDKKNAAKPKKVFTDDDVRGAVPESPAAGTATAGEQKTNDTGKKEDANGEAAWRKRFKEQRDRIAKAELELDVLQRESDKAQTQYYSDPQKALEEQNNRKDINDKKAKIDAKKAELDALKQGLDDLETELRKAGGDPGWAR